MVAFFLLESGILFFLFFSSLLLLFASSPKFSHLRPPFLTSVLPHRRRPGHTPTMHCTSPFQNSTAKILQHSFGNPSVHQDSQIHSHSSTESQTHRSRLALFLTTVGLPLPLWSLLCTPTVGIFLQSGSTSLSYSLAPLPAFSSPAPPSSPYRSCSRPSQPFPQILRTKALIFTSSTVGVSSYPRPSPFFSTVELHLLRIARAALPQLARRRPLHLLSFWALNRRCSSSPGAQPVLFFLITGAPRFALTGHSFSLHRRAAGPVFSSGSARRHLPLLLRRCHKSGSITAEPLLHSRAHPPRPASRSTPLAPGSAVAATRTAVFSSRSG